MCTSIPFTEAITPARVRYEPLIDEALRWCAERAVPADADLFALICASAGSRVDGRGGAPPSIWTRVAVTMLLGRGIANWCAHNGGTTCPVEVVPAIWHWLAFLDDTGKLHHRSDPLWELRKPLICSGGLDFEGRPRADDEPSPIPCECHLPYREAVAYLNELVREGVPIPGLVFRPRRGDASVRFEAPAPTQRRAKDPPRRAPARGGARPGSGASSRPRGRRW